MVYQDWWQKDDSFTQKACHKMACCGRAHAAHLPLDTTSTLLPAKTVMDEAPKIPSEGLGGQTSRPAVPAFCSSALRSSTGKGTEKLQESNDKVH